MQVINTMHELGFQLESAANVFGPGSNSILVFGLHPRGPDGEAPPREPVWAMTVMNPKKVVLVDAPQEVIQIFFIIFQDFVAMCVWYSFLRFGS